MNKIKKYHIPFTQVPNKVLCDPNLSLKAKGLYAYMLSKPDEWTFRTECILQEIKEGRNAFFRIIKELEDRGYIKREQSKNPETGRYESMIYEFVDVSESSATNTQNPCIKNRYAENAGVVNNNNTENKNIYNINNIYPPNPPKGNAHKNVVNDLFEEFWKAYTPVFCDGRCTGRGSKHNAKQKFEKAVAQGAKPEVLVAKAKEYIADCIRSKRLSKAVSTWLNQKCWEDDYTLDEPTLDASEVIYWWNRLAVRWALPVIAQVTHEQLVECEARLKDSGCTNLHDMFARLDDALAGSLWLRGRRMRLVNGEWECENGDWQPNFNYFLKREAFLEAVQGGKDDKKVVELKQQGRWEWYKRGMTRDIGDF